MENTKFLLSSREHELIEERLLGYVELSDSLIIQNQGLQLYRSALGKKSTLDVTEWHDGAYIGCFDIGGSWLIRTDIAGQELLYVYQCDDNWCVSNSLYDLRNMVREVGWQLTSDIVGLSFLGDKAWNAQPTTNRTVFNEVKLMFSNQFVLISKASSALTIETQQLSDIFQWDSDLTCRDLIEKGLNDAVNSLYSFTNISPDFHLICQLSGGRDSRTTFGMLTKLDLDDAQVSVQSNKQSRDELKVAESIAAAYGYHVNDFKLKKRSFAQLDDVYGNWKRASLGSYTPIYCGQYANPNFGIQIKGDICISSSFYGQSFDTHINRLKKSIKNSDIQQEVSQELRNHRSNLEQNGFSTEQAKALLYLFYRSRFHSGRRWSRQLNQLGFVHAPLMKTSLIKAALKAIQDGHSFEVFKSTLLIALDHRLAQFPYGDSAKDITQKDIDNSLFVTPAEFNLKRKSTYFDEAELRSSDLVPGAKKVTRQQIIERLKLDFDSIKEELKTCEWFDTSLIERAEKEFIAAKSLAHHFRATVCCLHAGFALHLI